MRHTAVVGLVVSGILAAACAGGGGEKAGGESAPATTSGSLPGACDLVTQAEAQHIYGPDMAMVPSRSTTDTGPAAVVSNCFYATSGDSMKTLNVLVRTSLVGEDDLGNRDRFVAANRQVMGDDFQVQTVDGLSAPAAWQPLGSNGTLFAFLGTRHLSVNADPAGGRAAREIATELTEKALARLGAK